MSHRLDEPWVELTTEVPRVATSEVLVPFSCKTRGLCGSCDGRRMVAGAADLVDHVLPS